MRKVPEPPLPSHFLFFLSLMVSWQHWVFRGQEHCIFRAKDNPFHNLSLSFFLSTPPLHSPLLTCTAWVQLSPLPPELPSIPEPWCSSQSEHTQPPNPHTNHEPPVVKNEVITYLRDWFAWDWFWFSPAACCQEICTDKRPPGGNTPQPIRWLIFP